MVRGTRNLFGAEANLFREISDNLRTMAMYAGYQEFIPSALSETEVFVNKAGAEILGQMYTFQDKKSREICLVPEITAVVQGIYKEEWSKRLPKPVKIFYLARCYLPACLEFCLQTDGITNMGMGTGSAISYLDYIGSGGGAAGGAGLYQIIGGGTYGPNQQAIGTGGAAAGGSAPAVIISANVGYLMTNSTLHASKHFLSKSIISSLDA
jgi:hypothetical protein